MFLVLTNNNGEEKMGFVRNFVQQKCPRTDILREPCHKVMHHSIKHTDVMRTLGVDFSDYSGMSTGEAPSVRSMFASWRCKKKTHMEILRSMKNVMQAMVRDWVPVLFRDLP